MTERLLVMSYIDGFKVDHRPSLDRHGGSESSLMWSSPTREWRGHHRNAVVADAGISDAIAMDVAITDASSVSVE